MSYSLVPLISALRAEDTASPAALALAECARKIIFELIQALSDGNVNVRNHAVSALGRICEVSKEIIPALIMVFTDEDEAVCECAAGALGKVGEPAIPALMEVLSDVDNQVRFYTVFALGWIASTPAVPALIEVLNDADEAVSEIAEQALREIGSTEALKAIRIIKS
ncbi:MAG: HEAT repeat domain-containing protein, partial [Candidatus Poribacteria bacterium]